MLVKSQCNTTHHRKCLDSGLRPENNQHTSHNDISITIDTDHDISQHSRMRLIHNPCFVKNIIYYKYRPITSGSIQNSDLPLRGESDLDLGDFDLGEFIPRARDVNELLPRRERK